MGVIYAFCTTRNLKAIETAYERAMIREIALILRHIPQEDLAIQWDFCHELIMLDGQPQDQFPMVDATFDSIMARIARLADAVPAKVELGFHLCYGDFGAKHFIEPVDAGKLVETANGIAAAVKRPLQWIHMPVPVSRTDDAYFAPLARLQLHPETELYLGLIHASDGIAGTQQRIAVASRYATGFGVATECGIARARKPGLVRELLALHAQAAAEPACC
jgi:methionine synthase II (cobalamin-independent)